MITKLQDRQHLGEVDARIERFDVPQPPWRASSPP
jgi:hypothetical protein